MKKKIRRRKNEKQDSSSNPATSRQWAFEFIEQWRSEGRLVRDLLIKAGNSNSEQHQGARWAERLILRKQTIDAVLSECVSRPRQNVQFPLWTLLQLGAAELLYGPKKSQHAAISETVELCRYAGHPEWTGFLNGVLRGVQRLLDLGEEDEEQEDQLPQANRYPATGRVYRSLKKEIFPDPETELSAYLTTAFSLPFMLVNRWVQAYKTEEVYEIAWASLNPPPMTVRINRMLIEPKDWIAKCEQDGIKVETTDTPEAIRLMQSIRISDLPGFTEGEFLIQDETAMHAARLLNPHPKQNVLDLCAGPGTKSTQLAELMLDQGRVVATEIVDFRLDQVEENAERLGYECIETLLIDRHEPEVDFGPFDAILVDAPCSNTGVLGKRPEARWRFSSDEIEELNDIQHHLLNVAASHLVEEQGRIVYSTCSIDSRENEELIADWVDKHPDFVCSEMKLILPNKKHDGGFSALLEMEQPEESDSDSESKTESE